MGCLSHLSSLRDRQKRTRKFLLNWYFHSVSLLSGPGWCLKLTFSLWGHSGLSDSSPARPLWPPLHNVGRAPHLLTTGSLLASRFSAVHPSPDSVGISCHQAKALFEQMGALLKWFQDESRPVISLCWWANSSQSLGCLSPDIPGQQP